MTGTLVLDAVPDPTRRVWAPTLDDAARLALALVAAGDVVVTLGVGEPWRVARAIVEGLPDSSGRPRERCRSRPASRSRG